MKSISRRDFIKQIVIGGVVLSLDNIMVHPALHAQADGKFDIGLCKSVRIKCVSEIVCHDMDHHVNTIRDNFGSNQWQIPWDLKNAAGNCALIEVEALDGRRRRFLFDVGWGLDYMQACFKREGIDDLLKDGQIDFVIISHEHLDHFGGLAAALGYNPAVKLYIPRTLTAAGHQFIKQAAGMDAQVIGHRGELVQFEPGSVNKLYDGCAAVAFKAHMGLGVNGEQSLYFNIKDQGLVCVSGCCHQGIIGMAEFARRRLVQGHRLYGIYGGLHIAPDSGFFMPGWEETVKGLAKYNFAKIAANHCTGRLAAEKMIALGLPLVRGTGRHGSKTDLYVGNGDEVVFG